jgi:hypothetical protein
MKEYDKEEQEEENDDDDQKGKIEGGENEKEGTVVKDRSKKMTKQNKKTKI